MTISNQTPLDMFHGQPEIAPPAIDAGKVIIACFLFPGRPDGLEESIIGFVFLSLIPQGQAQIQIRFAVTGIGIVLRHPGNGCPEVCFGFLKPAPAQKQRAQRVVGPDIPGVTPESFPIIGIGEAGGMAVLLQMNAGQVQLFIGPDFFRRSDRRHGIRDFLDLFGSGRIFQQPAAAGGIHRHRQCRFRNGNLHFRREDIDRTQVRGFFENGFPICRQRDPGFLKNLCGIYHDPCFPVIYFQVEHAFLSGVFHVSGRFVGHKVLGEGFLFKRPEPGKVRLIVTVHAGHELDIRAIPVRQVPVPGPPEIAAAPGPLLFSGGNVVIGDMQNACLDTIIITAYEIIIAVGTHVAGGDGDIFIPGYVHPGTVIVLIVYAGGNGKLTHVPLAVIEYGGHIRREDALRIAVHRHGRIGPPQEGLRQAGAVIELAPDLDIGPARIQCNGQLSLGTVHLIHFRQLHRHAAVRIFQRPEIGGPEGGGPVMLRPVEFYAAADPRAGKPHQRGFDDLVVIHEVIAVGFVICPLDTASQFGKHHGLDILVFQPYGGIGLLFLFIQNLVDYRQGIYLAAAALIYPLFQKHGIFIGLSNAIGGDHHCFHPNAGAHAVCPPLLKTQKTAGFLRESDSRKREDIPFVTA